MKRLPGLGLANRLGKAYVEETIIGNYKWAGFFDITPVTSVGGFKNYELSLIDYQLGSSEMLGKSRNIL